MAGDGAPQHVPSAGGVFLKRAIDIVVSVVALIVLSPLLAVMPSQSSSIRVVQCFFVRIGSA